MRLMPHLVVLGHTYLTRVRPSNKARLSKSGLIRGGPPYDCLYDSKTVRFMYRTDIKQCPLHPIRLCRSSGVVSIVEWTDKAVVEKLVLLFTGHCLSFMCFVPLDL